MGEPLEYDEAEARQEEAIYQTPAMEDRRRLVRERLDLESGETVLSIGCGPGFEPAELAPVVGDEGQVHAIDQSEAMLALADRRCGDRPQVTLTGATATDLPIADETVDAATAVQVYRYLEALEPALEELHRVLGPGGRAVVYDSDFDSLVWHATNRDRTARVLEAFDDACPRPRLGSKLAPHLREAGFLVERVEPNTILETSFDEESFAYRLAQAIADYAAAHEAVDEGEPAAWLEDLRAVDERGETFVSLTQYCYLVRKDA